MADSPVEGIRDLSEGVKAEFLSRMRSPLVGAFVLSWMVWNHRVLFVLFSDMKVGKKFDFIDIDLYPSLADFWIMNALWPSLSAIGYIFLVPPFTRLVHRWNLYRRRLSHEDEVRSEGLKVLPVEEGKRLRELASEKRMEAEALKREVAGLGLEMIKLRAMHSCCQYPEVGRSRPELADYLVSRSFVMWSVVKNTAISRHDFGVDGALVSFEINKGYIGGADGWELVETTLRLFVKEKVLGELVFDSSNGGFDGNSGGIPVRFVEAQ
jgi:hypothetical protein